MIGRAGTIPLLITLVATPSTFAVVPVNYQVRFQATWSEANHPGAYPSNAHFSRLVGGTHNDQVSFWEEGGEASLGIERMAESGTTGSLLSEVGAAAVQGNAQFNLLGPSMSRPPASKFYDFLIIESHPLVTLVTMIAPSPDWFVGVSGLPLRENDKWIGQVVVDLQAYDAGTDSGLVFTSPNSNTLLPEPIHMITDGPLGGLPPLGRFVFTLQPGLPGDFDLDGDVDGDDFLVWQVGFGEFSAGGAFVNDGDGDGDGNVDGDDFLIWQGGFGAAASLSEAAVPEPDTAAIALAILCLGGLTRKHPFR